MEFDKILIYGSTELTNLCVRHLQENYNVVGYIPSVNPTVPGRMNTVKRVNEDVGCDLRISIQYDRKINKEAFNLHTGLLPEYGGCDILHHTLKEKSDMQGLTFHKITDRFDYGPIISTITYPVFKTDNILSLYRKILTLGPTFLMSCLKLLEDMWIGDIDLCPKKKPRILKRGQNIPGNFQQYIDQQKKALIWSDG